MLAVGTALVASRDAQGAADDGPAVPKDAEGFGFVVRGHADGVALLEATRPFSLALSNGPVHGTSPSRDRFTRTAALVSRELARYPVAFLRKVRLAGVVVTDNLAENEMPIPSLPNVGGLLLLAAVGEATSAETNLVRTLHHEVFHFFNLADDGRVAPDQEWSALNPPGFAYGAGGRSLRAAWAGRPSDELPGFLSGYATSGVEEDKADTFALAVARRRLVEARIMTDSILRSKVAEVTRRVGTFDEDAPIKLGIAGLAR